MFSYMNRGRAFYKRVVSLAFPLILQNLITDSLALMDTFMIGMLGEAPLAGVTLANIPIFVVILMTFGFQSGSAVLISQFWGKKDEKSICRVMGIAMYVAGALTFLFALVLLFVPGPFMSLFGNDPEVIAVAARYGRIVGFSYFLDSFTQLYIAAHRSMGNPSLGLYILGLSMVSNTFLNWVLIFGHLGFPALGVEGGALATLIARALGLAVTIVHARTNKTFRPTFSILFRPGKALWPVFLRYASPVVLNETMWSLGTSLYTTIMGHMAGSKEILASYAIAGNVEKICTVVIFALAHTAAILIGQEIGSGHRENVTGIGRCLNLLSAGVSLVVGGAMLVVVHLLFPSLVYPIFDLSAGSSSITTMMLTVTFCILWLRSYNCTNIVGVLRGGGDVRAATVIDLAPLWLVALPLSVLAGLVLKAGILWVYLAMTAEQIVKAGLGLSRFRSGEWIHDLTVFASEKEGSPS